MILSAPLRAGQVEAPVSGEFKPGVQGGGIGSTLGAPVPLQMSVPSLNGSVAPTLAASLVTAAPTLQPSAAVALQAKPVAAQALPTAAQALPAAAVPGRSGLIETKGAAAAPVPGALVSPTADVDAGRVRFDQSAAHSGDEALPVGGAWSSPKSGLTRGAATPAPAQAEPKVPGRGKARFWEAAELGFFGMGWQLVTGIAFLIAGAHAAFPALAGALWALGGAEMIRYLGSLRSVIVGGWQASHDQKMRHDYGTGELKDIRGKKYGEDRYDEKMPGPVSARERAVLDIVAVGLGLPWVLGGGAAAVGLYLLSAAAAIAVRRAWQKTRPKPRTATAKDAIFERER